jgi:hypothetical protein
VPTDQLSSEEEIARHIGTTLAKLGRGVAHDERAQEATARPLKQLRAVTVLVPESYAVTIYKHLGADEAKRESTGAQRGRARRQGLDRHCR